MQTLIGQNVAQIKPMQLSSPTAVVITTTASRTTGSTGSVTSQNGDDNIQNGISKIMVDKSEGNKSQLYQMVNVNVNGVYKNLLVPINAQTSNPQLVVQNGSGQNTSPLLTPKSEPSQSKTLTSQNSSSSLPVSSAVPSPSAMMIIKMATSGSSTGTVPPTTVAKSSQALTKVVQSSNKSIVSPVPVLLNSPTKPPSLVTVTPEGLVPVLGSQNQNSSQACVSLLKQALNVSTTANSTLTSPWPNIIRSGVPQIKSMGASPISGNLPSVQNSSRLLSFQSHGMPPVEAVKHMLKSGMIKVPTGSNIYVTSGKDGKTEVHLQAQNPPVPQKVLVPVSQPGKIVVPLPSVVPGTGRVIRTVSSTSTNVQPAGLATSTSKPIVIVPGSSVAPQLGHKIVLVPTSQAPGVASSCFGAKTTVVKSIIPNAGGSATASKILYAMSSAPVTKTVASTASNICFSTPGSVISPISTIPPINVFPSIKTEPPDSPPQSTPSTFEDESSPVPFKIDSVYSLSEQENSFNTSKSCDKEDAPVLTEVAPTLPDDHPGVITIQPELPDPEMPKLYPEITPCSNGTALTATVKTEPTDISSSNVVRGDDLQVRIAQQVVSQLSQSNLASSPPSSVLSNSKGCPQIRIISPKQAVPPVTNLTPKPLIIRSMTSPVAVAVRKPPPPAIRIVSDSYQDGCPENRQVVTIKSSKPVSGTCEKNQFYREVLSPSSKEALRDDFYRNLMKALLPPDTIDEDLEKHLPESFSSAARQFAQDTIKTSKFTTSKSVVHFPVSPVKKTPQDIPESSHGKDANMLSSPKVFHKKNPKRLSKRLRRLNTLPVHLIEQYPDMKPSFVRIPKVKIPDVKATIDLGKATLKDLIDPNPVKKRKRKRKPKKTQRVTQLDDSIVKSRNSSAMKFLGRSSTKTSPMQSLLKPAFMKKTVLHSKQPKLMPPLLPAPPPIITVGQSGNTVATSQVVQQKVKYYLIKTSNQTFLVPMSTQLDAVMKQNPAVASTLIQAALNGNSQVVIPGASPPAPVLQTESKTSTPVSVPATVPVPSIKTQENKKGLLLASPVSSCPGVNKLPSTVSIAGYGTPLITATSNSVISKTAVSKPPGTPLIKTLVPKSEPSTQGNGDSSAKSESPVSAEANVNSDNDNDWEADCGPSPPKSPRVDDEPLDTKSRIERLKAMLRQQEEALTQVRKKREESRKVMETIDLI